MNNTQITSNKTVTLCGRGSGKCCPVMSIIDENRVKITDDDGNHIIITKEQAKLMSMGVDALNEEKQQLLCD